LGIRQPPFFLNVGEKGCYDHPVYIIEEIQQKQQGENIIGAEFRQLVLFGCSHGIHFVSPLAARRKLISPVPH
jgi:hypothetical protein